MSTESYTFHHPSLGALTGLITPASPSASVVSFRSIPFAIVPGRFKQSVLLDHIPKSSSGEANSDFTNYGTACPGTDQLVPPSPVGGLLPGESREYDEFTCLNLSINVPKACLEGKMKDLPVMVYVHGGAFKEGAANISLQHDTSAMVDLSIQEGKPMIGICIHYRLGWFGFLACQDLINESIAEGSAPSNYGLHDQRNAFKWIHNQISGFGGSPSKITAFGESAGSVSIAMHMSASVPLFNRAVLQSGTTATVPPAALGDKEAEYKSLLKFLGINHDDKDRLEKLRAVPAEKLVEANNGVGVPIHRPFADQEYKGAFFSRGVPDWWTENKLLNDCDWVDEVIIGEDFFEGWILHQPLTYVGVKEFVESTIKYLGEQNASKLFAAYDVAPDMDRNKFGVQLALLMGDITFSEPANKIARALAAPSVDGARKKKVYRYNVTLRNPFPGTPFYQVPGHHFVEVLFLFGTFRFRYPTQKLVDISTEFMRRWIAFGVGEAPWDEYELNTAQEEDAEKIMIISSSVGFEQRTRKEDEEKSKLSDEGERRYKQWEVISEIMQDMERKNRDVRILWGPDGGIYRLAGLLPELSPLGLVH